MTQPKTQKCIAKVGEPDERKGMRVCGADVHWKNAGEDGAVYSGWAHVDGSIKGHGAVPASYI